MVAEPLNDRILIKRNEAEEVSEGGILLITNEHEKPSEGVVVAVGPGRYNSKGDRVPIEVKKGDMVLFSQYGGTEVSIDGEGMLIMREDDVLAIVK